ncbi:uncharacterized protein PHACADRAFT_182526 [Phanerochaete carnosa HHB-10118-sp]|uniref:Uncharacterized protein n=1 Tax=Phanerochaete carnosa (strain HHB-10118-sp) TaxID=650164 RepID=K5WFR5_PHACS|nr:uncharacterized protein PHACADRAFT_182526 [Phanerochaete carnosa HHB-10118-sp]EKM58155.1 hypothetical protein PHACADRAFT_182526 [Phanerochaete carnosa HHB-10118-sp]
MAFVVAKSDFVGTLLETLCYGMYFVLFSRFLCVLYARQQAGRRIRYLLAIALMIFSLITAHLAIQVNRILHAFTDHMDVANAPVTFYHALNRRESAVKTAIYTALTLLCDVLMVYRVFVVYERKRSTIVVPCLLFLADTVTLALNLLCTGKGVEYERDG